MKDLLAQSKFDNESRSGVKIPREMGQNAQ